MTANKILQKITEERLSELYNGVFYSVSNAIFFTAIVFFQYSSHHGKNDFLEESILLVWLIAVLRFIDRTLFFKQQDREKNTARIYCFRFAFGVVLSAISWAVLFWNFIPTIPETEQAFVFLIVIGVMSFTTISLSYQLGLFFLFQLIVLISVELRMLQTNHFEINELMVLLPIFLLFQSYTADRLFTKFSENIRLHLINKEKEKVTTQRK